VTQVAAATVTQVAFVTLPGGKSLVEYGEPPQRGLHMPDDRREKIHRAVDEAARAEESHDKQQRNAGVAIALLALVVMALLIAIVTGATDVLGG
jgi:hypothetical protein